MAATAHAVPMSAQGMSMSYDHIAAPLIFLVADNDAPMRRLVSMSPERLRQEADKLRRIASDSNDASVAEELHCIADDCEADAAFLADLMMPRR
jgi:hypothetical protein